MLKLLFLFGVLAVLTPTRGLMPAFVPYKQACLEETGLTEEDLPRPPAPGSPPPSEPRPEPSQKFKCFFACLVEKIGILNSSGELQIEKIPVQGVDFSTCKEIQEADRCEKAFLVERCIKKIIRASKPN